MKLMIAFCLLIVSAQAQSVEFSPEQMLHERKTYQCEAFYSGFVGMSYSAGQFKINSSSAYDAAKEVLIKLDAGFIRSVSVPSDSEVGDVFTPEFSHIEIWYDSSMRELDRIVCE